MAEDKDKNINLEKENKSSGENKNSEEEKNLVPSGNKLPEKPDKKKKKPKGSKKDVVQSMGRQEQAMRMLNANDIRQTEDGGIRMPSSTSRIDSEISRRICFLTSCRKSRRRIFFNQSSITRDASDEDRFE